MANRIFLIVPLMLISGAGLVACKPEVAPMPTIASPESNRTRQVDINAKYKLARLFSDYYDDNLQLNPLSATFNGDPRFNDQLPNFFGPGHRAKQLQFQEEYLDQIEQIDRASLSSEHQLSYDIFRRDRQQAIAGHDHPGHLQPINQFRNITNTLARLGSGKSAQPFKTVQDYDNWLARIDAVPALLDQAIENMQEGVEKRIVQPRVLMQRSLPQIKAHIVSDATTSLFYKPIDEMPESFAPSERERLTSAYADAISNKLVPAYQKLHDYIENDYLNKTRDTDGLGALPGGSDWYAFNVARITTTDLTPAQIHQIGLGEVARIQNEMREVMKQVNFDGDLPAFFEFTRSDPRFFYQEREQLLDAFRAVRARVDQGVTRLFDMFPKSDYEIRAVEAFREKSAASGSYQNPSEDGSRPGIFYANTYDLSARPSWTVESLFLHEAAPGHHFQIAIQQELDTLPKFRRFGRSTAFAEGWALYAESLGKELGVYQDPYQYFGALAAELWRAVRLVVDTGLHDKGWTREQVLQYMYDNTPTAETRAISEAERFMAIPGQALAYKIGQLKIRELRSRAETALGNRFDIKAFHREVLKDGAVPLDILEAKIDRWIADQSASQTASQTANQTGPA